MTPPTMQDDAAEGRSVRINDNERKVLTLLADHYNKWEGGHFWNFGGLSEETGLNTKLVRRACRSLKRKGLTEFSSGLWTDDGTPAGSGYAATKAGAEFVKANP